MATQVNLASVTLISSPVWPRLRPGLDVQGHRGAADADHVGVAAHDVAHEHRLMEGQGVHGDGGDAAARAGEGDRSGGDVHLRQQPAAENVARRVGVGRHGQGPHGGLQVAQVGHAMGLRR